LIHQQQHHSPEPD